MAESSTIARPRTQRARDAVLYRWESPKGTFVVHRLSETVFRSEATGAATGLAMEGFIAQLDSLVAQGCRGMLFFHDWSEMASYEPSMRHKLTDWRRAAPAGTTEAIHVLLRSSLVTLGVTASSVALRLVGIELYTYTDRLVFERKLASATARERAIE